MSNDVNFAFFGTPDFAVGVLEELEKKSMLPSLIVTAPDKPKGRGLVLTPSPVKVWAEERKIPVLQPESLSSNSSNLSASRPYPQAAGPDADPASKLLELLSRHDLFIVAAYGKLIPKNILDIPKYGALNVHPSLLPRLRGASPIESAILSEEKTGVTIIQMDGEMDHGPIIAQREKIIKDFRNNPPKATELEKNLAHFGGALLAEVIPEWLSGELRAVPQDHSQATYCKKITKDMGLIDLKEDALKNLRKIRAFDVWPGAYFFADLPGKDEKGEIRVKIVDAEIEKEGTAAAERLRILQVIPGGKKKMAYADFLRGISR